jgi:hypothetical protein
MLVTVLQDTDETAGEQSCFLQQGETPVAPSPFPVSLCIAAPYCGPRVAQQGWGPVWVRLCAQMLCWTPQFERTPPATPGHQQHYLCPEHTGSLS